MKLLIDENFPPSLISYFQRKRHNVKRIQRTVRGVSDGSVRELALKEKRVIITFDRDFLSSNIFPKIPLSVVVFDFPKLTPEQITPYLDHVLISFRRLRVCSFFIS